MLTDFIKVYTISLNKTFSKVKKNPIIFLMPLMYSIIMGICHYLADILLSNIVGTTIWRFLIPLIDSLIISSYFTILEDLIMYNRINFKYFTKSFVKKSGLIYSTFFTLILMDWAFFIIINLDYTIELIISSILGIVLSSVSEYIYLRGISYTEGLISALKFFKENFFLWLPPIIILFLGKYILFDMIDMSADLSDLVMTQTIGSPFNIYLGQYLDLGYIIRFIIFEVIVSLLTVFRGVLFNIIEGSSIRKRKYRGYDF